MLASLTFEGRRFLSLLFNNVDFGENTRVQTPAGHPRGSVTGIQRAISRSRQAFSLLLIDRKRGRDEQYLFKKLGFIASSYRQMPPASLAKGNQHGSVFMILTSGMFPLIKRALSGLGKLNPFSNVETLAVFPTNKALRRNEVIIWSGQKWLTFLL